MFVLVWLVTPTVFRKKETFAIAQQPVAVGKQALCVPANLDEDKE